MIALDCDSILRLPFSAMTNLLLNFLSIDLSTQLFYFIIIIFIYIFLLRYVQSYTILLTLKDGNNNNLTNYPCKKKKSK